MKNKKIYKTPGEMLNDHGCRKVKRAKGKNM